MDGNAFSHDCISPSRTSCRGRGRMGICCSNPSCRKSCASCLRRSSNAPACPRRQRIQVLCHRTFSWSVRFAVFVFIERRRNRYCPGHHFDTWHYNIPFLYFLLHRTHCCGTRHALEGGSIGFRGHWTCVLRNHIDVRVWPNKSLSRGTCHALPTNAHHPIANDDFRATVGDLVMSPATSVFVILPR